MLYLAHSELASQNVLQATEQQIPMVLLWDLLAVWLTI